VQYARDPAQMIRRFASWTKPGGRVFVCVDSLLAVILELVSQEKIDDALRILNTGRGVFTYRGETANLHVYDRRTLESYFAAAGLIDLECYGLLISMSARGRAACLGAIAGDKLAFLDEERKLGQFSAIADLGKHLVIRDRRPIA
jgi:hypothetical protein